MKNSLIWKLVFLNAILSLPVFGEDSDAFKKVAIFLANRDDTSFNDQLPIFEDVLTATVTDLGFGIVSREIVVSAVGDLKRVSEQNELDALLDDQTSALRLSQNLGADYLLFASVVGLDTETRNVNAYGVEFTNLIHTLRTTYRILDGSNGESITADISEVSRSIQQTKHSHTKTTGLKRELLVAAARDIASNLRDKKSDGRIRTVNLEESKVEMQVAVGISDINFPEVVIDKEGNTQITANRSTVQALAVTVELDGFTIGTTGTGDLLSSFKVAPGLHRIRLSREDLVPWERMINIYDGMQLNVSMQLTPEGLARWRENTRIFNEMKKDAVLTAAQAESIRGLGQMLRQSGFMVNVQQDKKEDIKVNTKEGVDIHNDQSLFDND